MKEYDELFAKYSKLGLDVKRNIFNEESKLFIIIGKQILSNLGHYK